MKPSWGWQLYAAGMVLALNAGMAGVVSNTAVIEYLPHENAIWVRGFSASRPATPDDLIAADQAQGWQKVIYTPSNDTCCLRTALWIGGVSGERPTYLQIGRPGHERETVIVQGDVWIRAAQRVIPGIETAGGLINRLTLGDPTNTAIHATLKIACETNGQYGLMIGFRAADLGVTPGGELWMFNSTLTAATPDLQHRMRGAMESGSLHTGAYAAQIRLIGSTISWFSGCALYGVDDKQATLERCTFENGGSLMENGSHRAVDCVFRRLECPFRGVRIEYLRCRFEENENNWNLNSYNGYGVELIDCQAQPPRRPARLAKNEWPAMTLLRNGLPLYPALVERRSLVVRVTDDRQQPVPGAVVSIRCLNDRAIIPEPAHPKPGASATEHLAAVRNPIAITDTDGYTPRRAEDGALLPAIRRQQATDDPAAPREETFQYEVTVEAAGYRSQTLPLASDRLPSDPMNFVLKPMKDRAAAVPPATVSMK